MAIAERVLIAGAGPVGLTAAANLIRNGIPVTVFEAGADLSEESRASTFHPPTLDMLDRLGAAKPLIAQGLVAPGFQYRSKRHGVIGEFDFAAIADVTGHPHRLQSEQSNLTRILYDRLRESPLFDIRFDSPVAGVTQSASGVAVAVGRNGRNETHAGRWMRERDYTAWLGVRSLGEAVTRTNSNNPKVLRDYLRGAEFQIGSFKGEALTFRTWNHQMRQPILLAAPRMLVSVSPQEGFLHQRTPLDTLGFDEPESSCRLE